jgi:glycine/D-amino acid oxidase-like deaminating enzyme
MELRSGVSLWQGIEVPPVEIPALDHDARCEVAVVGAGITGTLVAYYLLQEGVDTILLDKHAAGAGSTAASTGLLQYEVDTPLCRLIKNVGESAAVRAYRLGLHAVDEIERIVADLPDNCGFARVPSYYLASSPKDLRELNTECACRACYGFDVSFLTASEIAEIASFHAPGAIRSQGDAQINPLHFTRELLRRLQRDGLRAYGRCDVNDIIPDANGVLLTTERATVHARRVVIATGYAAHAMLKQDLGSLHSTYAAASAALSGFVGWPEKCMLWETARPYFYLRSTPDGRAMMGGEDTAFSTDHKRDKLLAQKLVRLRERFEQMFPRITFEPEYLWAGTFAQTKDGLAYIGESPELPNTYFALGYGGNGITFGVVAARIIADLYVRRPNPDAHIFRFER